MKQFICLGENTKKYITFAVPIEKEATRIDKNREEIKNMCYILPFIDSTRFMVSSLSNIVNNLSEGNHGIKCIRGHDDKKYDTFRIKYKYCDCFLEYTILKDDLIEYKYLCCNKNYQHKFDENLKERFFNTYKFSENDNNKFISLLRKGIYPYKYMDDWEKFNETSLSEKENFYNHLYIRDITDADYAHTKIVFKDSEVKHLGEYHDLYVQSSTLWLADEFENF